MKNLKYREFEYIDTTSLRVEANPSRWLITPPSMYEYSSLSPNRRSNESITRCLHLHTTRNVCPPTRFQRDSTAIPDRGLRSTADLPRMDSRPRKISESRYAGLYFDLFGARISRFLLPREAGRGEACNNIYKAVRLGKQSTVYRIRWWQMPRA